MNSLLVRLAVCIILALGGFFSGAHYGRLNTEHTVIATAEPCPGPTILQDRITVSSKTDPKTGKVIETRVVTPTVTVVPSAPRGQSPATSRGQGTHEPKLVIQTKYRLGVEYVPSVSLTRPSGGSVGVRAGNLPIWVDLGYTMTVGPTVGLSYEW